MKLFYSRLALALVLSLILGLADRGYTQASEIVLLNNCGLADAIRAANTDSPVGNCPAGNGADTIILSNHAVLTAPVDSTNGSNGLPPITSEITIMGNGQEIMRESASNFRIFYVASTGILHLQSVIVRNGNAFDPGPDGGGIYVAAGGQVTLNRTGVMNNSANRYGGAIFNDGGQVTIAFSELSASYAGVAGGNIYNTNGGELSLESSLVQGTPSPDVLGNGIYNALSTPASTVSISHSRVTGIYNASQLEVLNSTIAGTSIATGGYLLNTVDGDATVDFSSMINNPVLGWVTALVENHGTLTLRNSLLYNKGQAECIGSGSATGTGNLATTNACPGILDLLPIGSIDTQPHLYLGLIYAGGQQPVNIIPGTSSLAYNRLGNCGLTDQRYVPRDANCDVGAYEYRGGTINGNVWEDMFGNGTRNSLTSLPIDDVTVFLQDNLGNTIDTTTTSNGYYAFTGLGAGYYSVGINTPAGYIITRQDYGGGDIGDSDVDPVTGLTGSIHLLTDSLVVSVESDAGLYRPVTMAGIIYEDANANGMFDDGEVPIPSAAVTANRVNPSRTYNTYSLGDGAYLFTDMLPGLYTITVTLPTASAASASHLKLLPGDTRGDVPVLKALASSVTTQVNLFSGQDESMPYNIGVASSNTASPTQNYFTTTTPILTWSPVSWATGYQIEVAEDLAFKTVVDSATVPYTQLSYQTDTLQPRSYYWRVRAQGQPGNAAQWSTPQKFIIVASG